MAKKKTSKFSLSLMDIVVLVMAVVIIVLFFTLPIVEFYRDSGYSYGTANLITIGAGNPIEKINEIIRITIIPPFFETAEANAAPLYWVTLLFPVLLAVFTLVLEGKTKFLALSIISICGIAFVYLFLLSKGMYFGDTVDIANSAEVMIRLKEGAFYIIGLYFGIICASLAKVF